MKIEPPAALESLEAWMGQWASALVAYSGGVDSAVVLAAAHRVLGDGALGCLAVSPSLPEREREEALGLARSRGWNLRQIETGELSDPHYAANPENRCYFCKGHLFRDLKGIADREGFGVVLDGTNADDTGDDRPGRQAADEIGVRSPLLELGLSKPDVRRLANHLGLSVWDKPAMACLASRIPYGTPITAEVLARVERAESVLRGLGFRQYRVRHHGETARIEIPTEDFPRILECSATIVPGIRAAGYRHVCLDLAGFRGGPAVAQVQQTSETRKT